VRLEAIEVRVVEREQHAAVLQREAGVTRNMLRSKTGKVALNQ